MIDSLEILATDNTLHNRLNFKWYPVKYLDAELGVRNRFIYGETLKYGNLFSGNAYSDRYSEDGGCVDLSYNWVTKTAWVLNSAIDRALINIHLKKFEATIGRQRINWGQCFVWNPNDIFNSYSYFDIDYEERSGRDAIRLQYYTGVASHAELATSIDADNKFTTAALYVFNKKGFDIQVLGGIVKEEDYVAGTGFSGYIKSTSIRAEFTYIHPVESVSDTSGVVIASLGCDHMFNNELFIQAEVLYNQNADAGQSLDLLSYYSNEMSVKNLSVDEWSFFVNASYPITPLFTVQLGGMYYLNLNGAFVNPSISYSLKENLRLSGGVQYFTYEYSGKSQDMSFAFVRLRQAF